MEVVNVLDRESVSVRHLAKRFNIGKTQAAEIAKNKEDIRSSNGCECCLTNTCSCTCSKFSGDGLIEGVGSEHCRSILMGGTVRYCDVLAMGSEPSGGSWLGSDSRLILGCRIRNLPRLGPMCGMSWIENDTENLIKYKLGDLLKNDFPPPQVGNHSNSSNVTYEESKALEDPLLEDYTVSVASDHDTKK
ncbi:unnamed protein product [Acanthoscelides obtectus]|uniref:HTH psq-type domain-containing protein n=1 Tax=Acanthoscelides obtectus TaxID=200917 RepID=A0A9P0LQQ7_ACAOB|nr:unnamed protein product [Acanthoscelides obtectus]CAK1634019.1 hypothetical protein AOBTE_LOCUS8541 [Acanthoscelides obtectus]